MGRKFMRAKKDGFVLLHHPELEKDPDFEVFEAVGEVPEYIKDLNAFRAEQQKKLQARRKPASDLAARIDDEAED